jgi:hypothetical protein
MIARIVTAMTTFLLILMALLLIAALERNHRRQPPAPPGPHGARTGDDRDWARIRLDLLALGSQPAWTRNRRNSPRPS